MTQAFDDYAVKCGDFRAARGEVKLIRDLCDFLYRNLAADLEAPLINLTPGPFAQQAVDGAESECGEDEFEEDEEGDEDLAQSLLHHWYSSDRLAEAILRLRQARRAVEEAWELLSETQKSAAKHPSEV